MGRPAKYPITIGGRYGRLTVLRKDKRKIVNQTYVPKFPSFGFRSGYTCLCECGASVFAGARSLSTGDTKSCGCLRQEQMRLRTRERHPNWKGGLTQHGYLRSKRDGKEMLDHRAIMEAHLGRSLTEDENVHHINGNRADNHLENLELWSTSQPCGQRIADKVAWAREILRLYDTYPTTKVS